MTEQEFRLEADEALDKARRSLIALADAEGFEVELQNGVLQIEFEEPGKRATALAELVIRLDEDYARHATDERREGRIGPENSWLGATDLIHEELHRMAVALQVRASQTTPEF